jgi:hypothetical protein
LVPADEPYLNGLAEAEVKSAKSILERGIGRDILTVVKFISISVTIEGLLNSRPISYDKSDE